MPRGLQHKGIVRKNKMLYAAVELFLKNGYEKTTTAAIAKAAGMAPSSFFAAFENKEELLLTLVKQMFSRQFSHIEEMIGDKGNPLMVYGMETVLQMYITELSDELRDLYVMAYSLPTTSEYIYLSTSRQLQRIFGSYMPEAKEKDFYELEIASAGITRAFMAKPSHMYFTIEDKIKRYLQCCFTLYRVDENAQKEVIQYVLSLDLHSVAVKLIEDTVKQAEKGFEQAIAEK